MLAARIGVEFVPVEYPTPPKAMDGLKGGACDVGFGALDESRAADIDFSPPILQFDFTYLVPACSSIRSDTEADCPGVRIRRRTQSRVDPAPDPVTERRRTGQRGDA